MAGEILSGLLQLLSRLLIQIYRPIGTIFVLEASTNVLLFFPSAMHSQDDDPSCYFRGHCSKPTNRGLEEEEEEEDRRRSSLNTWISTSSASTPHTWIRKNLLQIILQIG